MPRVIHFEINGDQPERAVKFYSEVFEWKIQKWDPVEYYLASTGEKDQPGIDGAIMRRMSSKETTINTIDVPSLDEYMAKVVQNGGKVVRPRATIPGVGYFAYCQDTEGNTFGILQQDTSAK
jgi:predicted enzyme related to lactoylglutathione lyase